jgi:hypothetical protein
MSYLELLAEDRELITYRKSLRRLAGSVTATILLQQIMYWSKRTSGQPFYKFKEPCEHELYQDGDSWTEELGFSPGEFDTAIKAIGTKLAGGQKPEEIVTDLNGPLEEQVKHLVIYWIDIQRRTWYMLNRPLADHLIARLYAEPDLRVTKTGTVDLRKSGTPVYRNREGRFTSIGNPDVVYTEITTEITTETTSPPVAASAAEGEAAQPIHAKKQEWERANPRFVSALHCWQIT